MDSRSIIRRCGASSRRWSIGPCFPGAIIAAGAPSKGVAVSWRAQHAQGRIASRRRDQRRRYFPGFAMRRRITGMKRFSSCASWSVVFPLRATPCPGHESKSQFSAVVGYRPEKNVALVIRSGVPSIGKGHRRDRHGGRYFSTDPCGKQVEDVLGLLAALGLSACPSPISPSSRWRRLDFTAKARRREEHRPSRDITPPKKSPAEPFRPSCLRAFAPSCLRAFAVKIWPFCLRIDLWVMVRDSLHGRDRHRSARPCPAPAVQAGPVRPRWHDEVFRTTP